MLVPVFAEVIDATGLIRPGHRLHLLGLDRLPRRAPFSFVMALDAVGAWPPIPESHVEMDGAWALYEAWVRLQHGDIDTALVYAFGKSSRRATSARCWRASSTRTSWRRSGPTRWPRRAAGAAVLDAGLCTERTWPRSPPRRATPDNPTPASGVRRPSCSTRRTVVDPLRKHDCPPVTDGAAAVVLAAGDRARELVRAPGVDPRHRPPHRAARARRARPHALAVDRARRGTGRRRRTASTSPSCTRPSRTRS